MLRPLLTLVTSIVRTAIAVYSSLEESIPGSYLGPG
jgi:hypothetical protein